MVEGFIPKQDVVDMLLDIRTTVTSQVDCAATTHIIAGKAINAIDDKIKELT